MTHSLLVDERRPNQSNISLTVCSRQKLLMFLFQAIKTILTALEALTSVHTQTQTHT